MATSIASPANFAAPAEIFAPKNSITPAKKVLSTGVAISTAPLNSATPASSNDSRRAWLWSFLALIAASQLYFFRELVAAFALFAIAFVAIAFLVAGIYMLFKCGELALTRLARLRTRVLQISPLPKDSQKPA
ncbi:MAG: hypothetical protein WBE13_04190 [Candidatus Acidiferrum sp.]